MHIFVFVHILLVVDLPLVHLMATVLNSGVSRFGVIPQQNPLEQLQLRDGSCFSHNSSGGAGGVQATLWLLLTYSISKTDLLSIKYRK